MTDRIAKIIWSPKQHLLINLGNNIGGANWKSLSHYPNIYLIYIYTYVYFGKMSKKLFL